MVRIRVCLWDRVSLKKSVCLGLRGRKKIVCFGVWISLNKRYTLARTVRSIGAGR